MTDTDILRDAIEPARKPRELKVLYGDGGDRRMFFCPGCNTGHVVNVGSQKVSWGFNRNEEAPTFTPSILTRDGQGGVCHSFVTDGNIQFLGDCTHALAGQTVPLPKF